MFVPCHLSHMDFGLNERDLIYGSREQDVESTYEHVCK